MKLSLQEHELLQVHICRAEIRFSSLKKLATLILALLVATLAAKLVAELAVHSFIVRALCPPTSPIFV